MGDKQKLLSAMAQPISAAGYKAIASEVRHGKRVEANVNYFLKLYKKRMYGKFYEVRADGSVSKGKVNPDARRLYDRVEKQLKKALQIYKKNYA
jgi:hypothetical protein